MVKEKEIDYCPACGSEDKTKYIYRKYYPFNNSKRVFNRNEFKEWIKFYLAKFLNMSVLKKVSSLNNLQNRISARNLFSSLFMIGRCKNCGYGRYEREMTDEGLYNYYANLYYSLESRDHLNDLDPASDERAVGQFHFACNEFSMIDLKNILEIGAAEAYASRLILEEYNDCSIDVVEPMKNFDKYYKQNHINKVAEFFPFTTEKKCDYIHTSHWLEHVRDLETTLSILKSMLVEKGVIFVEVPNCTDEYWQENKRDDHGHIHYFTEQSLISFFLSAGFELVKSSTVGLSHPDLNKYWISHKLLDSETLKRGSKSITNNIPNETGSYIRALFKSPN